MREIVVAIAIVVPLIVAILLPLFLSGGRWKAAQETARARRLADARMNARLLRFNL